MAVSKAVYTYTHIPENILLLHKKYKCARRAARHVEAVSSYKPYDLQKVKKINYETKVKVITIISARAHTNTHTRARSHDKREDHRGGYGRSL